MRKYLGILTLALGTATAWAQEVSTAPVRVNLLLQTNFAAQEKTPVAFSVKRTEITLSGQASQSLAYLVRLDPAATLFKDGLLSWEFAPALAVTAGRFKYPQSLEGRTPADRLLFIERSNLGRTFGDQREYGVQGAGRWSVLEYAAAMINDRTGAGRIGIQYGAVSLGATGLYGSTWRGRWWRMGIENRIQASSWTWQSELGYGEDWFDRQGGAYATLARRIGKFRPVARLEFWGSDPVTRSYLTVQGTITAGIDWFVAGDDSRGSKVSLNGILGEVAVRNNTALLVQWQVVW